MEELQKRIAELERENAALKEQTSQNTALIEYYRRRIEERDNRSDELVGHLKTLLVFMRALIAEHDGRD